jgi:hypothetical protein
MCYILFMFTLRAHVCPSARIVKQSLIFGRIFFNCTGHILEITRRIMGYVLIMFPHCVHACKRAFAGARMIKHSLIYGRILFKCAVNIPPFTTSSMGYLPTIHVKLA